MKKLTLTTVLNFGKHNGKTAHWVAENHPSYILRMDENTDWIVSNTVYALAKDNYRDSMQPDYYDVVDDNWGDRDDY